MTTANFIDRHLPTGTALVKPVTRKVAVETTDEPTCKAFYIVTTVAGIAMILMAVEAVASAVYFFTNVLTTY